MKKNINITLDLTTNKMVVNKDNIIKGDTLKLNLKFYSLGIPAIVTGQTITIILAKPDGNVITQELYGVGSAATAELTENATNSIGVVQGEVQCLDDEGTAIFNQFTYQVTKSMSAKVIEASTSEIVQLAQINALIDEYSTKDDLLVAENIKADTNIPALTTQNDNATTNITNLSAENDEAIANIATLQSVEFANEIQAARGTFDNLDARLDDSDSQLSEMKYQTTTRLFNKNISGSIWIRGTSDVNGDNTVSNSNETIQGFINEYKEYLMDGITIPIHIDYSSFRNLFYIEGGSIDNNGGVANIRRVVNMIKVSGLVVSALKVHISHDYADITAFGIDNWKTSYKALILAVAEEFKNDGIKHLTVLNEYEHIYGVDKGHDAFVLELFQIAKDRGYKTGVTFAGFDYWGGYETCSETVKQNCDYIYVNTYPKISNKKEKTTIDEGIQGWETASIIYYASHVKETYGKKIVISETGIQNFWESLTSPANWDWSGGSTVANGEPVQIYINGMFEVLKDLDIVEEVFWWYDIDYILIKPTLYKYLRGEKYE